MPEDRILVIKLGALGDFIQAMGPAAAIRRHHPDARITLLTTKPYAGLAEATRLFDEVWLDTRPKPTRPGKWAALRRRLRGAGFSRVYDLQTSDRSSFYFHLMRPDPPMWSGIARGCSHPHRNPMRDGMHTIDRQAEQLAMAGIAETPLPDISALAADVSRFTVSPPYALLVPGGAPHRPAKRWPAASFATLAAHLIEKAVTPVLIGGPDEAALAAEIARAAEGTRNLAGETSFADIAGLARDAAFAVGNDTGPMHIAAAARCPSVVLFSADSDPALCAPRGDHVTVLRENDLADLAVETVAAALPAS